MDKQGDTDTLERKAQRQGKRVKDREKETIEDTEPTTNKDTKLQKQRQILTSRRDTDTLRR